MYARLKQFRESLGLTQAEFGKSIGIAKSTYNNYEVGVREPKSDFWVAVAQKYHVTIDYLMGFSDEPYDTSERDLIALLYSPDEKQMIKKYRLLDIYDKQLVDDVLEAAYNHTTRNISPEDAGGVTYIKCYELPAAAGTGEPLGDTYYTDTIQVETQRLPRSAHICIRVHGNSMEPAYHDGDIVFVQRLDGESVRQGEIGIFVLNGDGYIKRLGNRTLESLNPEYDPIPIHDYDDLRCYGRVLGKL